MILKDKDRQAEHVFQLKMRIYLLLIFVVWFGEGRAEVYNSNTEYETKTGDEDSYTNFKDRSSIDMEITIETTGVSLRVNNVKVYNSTGRGQLWDITDKRFDAGVHLVALHQVTGHVMRAESFMTWQVSSDSQLVEAIDNIQDGRLLILMGMPDFISHLESRTIDVLTKLGAWFVGLLANNEKWCLVVYKGGIVVSESVITDSAATNGTEPMAVPPAHLHFRVTPMPERTCDWYFAEDLMARAAFCENYEGYGDFCNCHADLDDPTEKHKLDYPTKEVIPVAIITSHRLPFVMKQVNKIRVSPGGMKTPITLMVDGRSAEARHLARLLNVSVIENAMETPPIGSTRRISQNMKFSLKSIFSSYPSADKAIILEDDLDIAPDFIPYFHQTAKLLDSEKDVMCVNAYNYNAFPHTANNPARLLRTQGPPACGWMVKRQMAMEMIKEWAPIEKPMDWDYWLHYNFAIDMDIIIPEIPRTKHTGGGGVHVSGLEQYLYYEKRIMNNLIDVTLDVESVTEEAFMGSLSATIYSSEIVKFSDHPCRNHSLPTRNVNKTFLLFVHQHPKLEPSPSFHVITRCLGIEDRHLQETLLSIITVSFYGNQLHIIGCPSSSFCVGESEGDVYKATEEDLRYANSHPFRDMSVVSKYSRRIPATSFRDFVLLRNLSRHVRLKVWQ